MIAVRAGLHLAGEAAGGLKRLGSAEGGAPSDGAVPGARGLLVHLRPATTAVWAPQKCCITTSAPCALYAAAVAIIAHSILQWHQITFRDTLIHRAEDDEDFNGEGQGQRHQGRAEVYDFDAAVGATQQVGGLHVAVHHVVVMQVAQPLHPHMHPSAHGCMEDAAQENEASRFHTCLRTLCCLLPIDQRLGMLGNDSQAATSSAEP